MLRYRRSMFFSSLKLSTVTFALLSASLSVHAKTPMEARDIARQDLAHRDRSVHWPKEFDPEAAAQFSHNELFIPAPCSHVFDQMAEIARWPQWFVLVRNVRLQQPAATPGVGSTILLSIFDTQIAAKVTEWVPGERISWLPTALAPNESKHYHAWLFRPAAGGCTAITEEVGVGAEDQKTAKEGSFYMHRAHDLWLASLRFASE